MMTGEAEPLQTPCQSVQIRSNMSKSEHESVQKRWASLNLDIMRAVAGLWASATVIGVSYLRGNLLLVL
jgi:hypothetical protein